LDVSARRPLSVLVVDDNHDAAESCALLLGMLGHEVRVAANCREALAAVETFAPAAVVLDIGLPDGDGYQLAEQLVALLPRRPLLVALTGFGNTEERARAAGFDHHFLKPVDPLVLAALLANCAATRRGP
jgi:CheY-like chemotaxis protein